MNKQAMLDWAELVDSYRVFPRLFLIACFWWSADTSYQLLDWYVRLPDAARGLEATGFASVMAVAILGFLKLVFTTYSAAGRDWGPPAGGSSTSVTTVLAKTTEKSTSPES